MDSFLFYSFFILINRRNRKDGKVYGYIYYLVEKKKEWIEKIICINLLL